MFIVTLFINTHVHVCSHVVTQHGQKSISMQPNTAQHKNKQAAITTHVKIFC